MTEDQNKGAPPASPAVTEESTSGLRMILTMGGIGLVAGVLIVLTFQLTLPVIKINKTRALERAIFEVVPGAAEKVAFVLRDSTMEPLAGEDDTAFKYYACYNQEHRLVGVALEAAGQGFQDVVRLLYGYAPDRGCIIGMKILESKETPGLGDKIDKDTGFKSNFDCLEVKLSADEATIAEPLALVKHGEKTSPWQIEAITGATISSRAVTTILRESTAAKIPLVMEHLDELERKGQ